MPLYLGNSNYTVQNYTPESNLTPPIPEKVAQVANGGFQIMGCCGARFAFTMEEFNNPTSINARRVSSYNEQVMVPYRVFNKGVLLMTECIPDQVKEIPGTVVEHIKCGDETLSIRYRVEQLYDN